MPTQAQFVQLQEVPRSADHNAQVSFCQYLYSNTLTRQYMYSSRTLVSVLQYTNTAVSVLQYLYSNTLTRQYMYSSRTLVSVLQYTNASVYVL